jgi:TonB family protein
MGTLAGTSTDPVVTMPAPVAAASPPVAARAAAKSTVYGDPLAPRIANSDELRVKALLAERWRRGDLRPGAPVASLPTAGYVRNDRAIPSSAGSTAYAVESGAVATVALPADAIDRVFAIDPTYPAAALHNRIEGWVELMFTITETGAVRDIEVMDAQPRGVFESAATQAVGNWRYRPRLANGQPVPRRSVVTLRFNLDG